MFTASISKKDFRAGVLQVVVNFTDGSETVTEAFNVISKEDLDNKIQNKLNTLNTLSAFATSLAVGSWVKPQESTLTPLQIATQTLSDLKRLIELGVMKETDQEFIDAVSAYKTAANK